MKRAIWAVLLAGAASGGCRICQSPYDYTGPVVDSACPNCGYARSGSVLDGGAGGYVEGQPAYGGDASYADGEMAKGPTPAKRR